MYMIHHTYIDNIIIYLYHIYIELNKKIKMENIIYIYNISIKNLFVPCVEDDF